MASRSHGQCRRDFGEFKVWSISTDTAGMGEPAVITAVLTVIVTLVAAVAGGTLSRVGRRRAPSDDFTEEWIEYLRQDLSDPGVRSTS